MNDTEYIFDALSSNELSKIDKATCREGLLNFSEFHQPQMEIVKYTLHYLTGLTDTLDQYDINVGKVKDILFKFDSGFCKTLQMFNPIIVAHLDNGISTLLSGRHRVVAINTMAYSLNVSPRNIDITCIAVHINNVKTLAQATLAYNTNRSMNTSERKNVELTGLMKEPINTPETAQALAAKSKTKFKEALKHYTLNVLRNSFDLEISIDSIGMIMTRFANTILGIPELEDTIKCLRTEPKAWEDWTEFLYHAHEAGIFKARQGNIKRDHLPTYTQELLDAFLNYLS